MYPFQPGSFALILLDGAKPSLALFRSYQSHAHIFIAVDGAAAWALKKGFTPDLIIGDLDSFVSEYPPCEIKSVPEQNSNDLEKTLIHALDEGLKNLLIMGAFGLRADHFLTNIYVLKKYAERINLLFIDDKQMAFMCPQAKLVRILEHRDGYLSLFPLALKVGPITTQGVQYPLHGELLSLHDRIGTLNKIISDEAHLRCESPDLLVFLPHRRRARLVID
jgi:thiamine pyrophosphokinase